MSKIRKSARGQDCLIRIPGVCNGNPETTVHCHLPGAGMGAKHHDLFGARGCSSCHDEIDYRTHYYEDRTQVSLWFAEGVFRTQQQLIDEGLITT